MSSRSVAVGASDTGNGGAINWKQLDTSKAGDLKGPISYAECQLLKGVLGNESHPGNQWILPSACFQHDYRINLKWDSKTSDMSRRLTKGMNKVGFAPGCLQESDKPEEAFTQYPFPKEDNPYDGKVSLGECRTLALHLLETYGKTDLLPEACVNLGRHAAKGPSKAPAESGGAEANKTESSGGAGASDKPKSENQSGYIKTYKKLLQETEKWPILWD